MYRTYFILFAPETGRRSLFLLLFYYVCSLSVRLNKPFSYLVTMQQKIVFGKQKSDFIRITEECKKLIRIFTNEDLRITDHKLSLSMSNTCL